MNPGQDLNYHAETRVDSRQISPKDGLMLWMLDLISLARLASWER